MDIPNYGSYLNVCLSIDEKGSWPSRRSISHSSCSLIHIGPNQCISQSLSSFHNIKDYKLFARIPTKRRTVSILGAPWEMGPFLLNIRKRRPSRWLSGVSSEERRWLRRYLSTDDVIVLCGPFPCFSRLQQQPSTRSTQKWPSLFSDRLFQLSLFASLYLQNRPFYAFWWNISSEVPCF